MRKLLLGGLVAVAFIGGAGSAIATTSPAGSSEGHESDPYACPTEENPNPGGPAYDDAGDCANGAATYTVWVYDNQVHCAEPQAPTPVGGISAGGDQSPPQGYLEVCNDTSDGPVQGRVIVDGSTDDGLNATIDGDGDNPEHGTGWVGVHVDDSDPSVRCGDSNGNLDSQTPTDADTQDDCDPTA